jgi:Flp pilus assembly pilin Flp
MTMTRELSNAVRAFVRDEKGATAIEYALIAVFISVSIVVIIGSLGETVRNDLFGKVAAALGS